jgi:hypothetical protein
MHKKKHEYKLSILTNLFQTSKNTEFLSFLCWNVALATFIFTFLIIFSTYLQTDSFHVNIKISHPHSQIVVLLQINMPI